MLARERGLLERERGLIVTPEPLYTAPPGAALIRSYVTYRAYPWPKRHAIKHIYSNLCLTENMRQSKVETKFCRLKVNYKICSI